MRKKRLIHFSFWWLCSKCRGDEDGKLCRFCKSLLSCPTNPCRGGHERGQGYQIGLTDRASMKHEMDGEPDNGE